MPGKTKLYHIIHTIYAFAVHMIYEGLCISFFDAFVSGCNKEC